MNKLSSCDTIITPCRTLSIEALARKFNKKWPNRMNGPSVHVPGLQCFPYTTRLPAMSTRSCKCFYANFFFVSGVENYTFYFGVKYYAADPCKLLEEITR